MTEILGLIVFIVLMKNSSKTRNDIKRSVILPGVFFVAKRQN